MILLGPLAIDLKYWGQYFEFICPEGVFRKTWWIFYWRAY